MKRILLALRGKSEKTDRIGRALVEKASAEGISMSFESVVSEIAIRNKMHETHYDAVITMSTLEAHPFTVEALAAISEIDEDTKLIIVMQDNVKGTDYCAELLKNNLIYGVYMSEAKIPMLYNLIMKGRTRGEARAYYDLVLNAGKEEKLNRGIIPEEIRNITAYITTGAEGVEESLKERLDYMSKSCTETEKEAVFAALSEDMKAQVRKIPEYSGYFFDVVRKENGDDGEYVNIDVIGSDKDRILPPKSEKNSNMPDTASITKYSVLEPLPDTQAVPLSQKTSDQPENENVGATNSSVSRPGLFRRFARGVTDHKKEKEKEKDHKYHRGVIDIGIVGTRNGAGTTYTALMLADCLYKGKRVAYFEYNNSGDMHRLAMEFGSTSPEYVSLNGVDIYYDIDYSVFLSSHKDKYDCVFIDFGTLGRLGKKRDIFSSCSFRYICIPTSPWRICSIDYDINLIDAIDPNGKVPILAPLATKKTIKEHHDLKKHCGKRQIIPIPYSEEPLGCSPEIADYLKKMF